MEENRREKPKGRLFQLWLKKNRMARRHKQ